MADRSRLVSAHLALQDIAHDGNSRARFFIRSLYSDPSGKPRLDSTENMDDFLEFVLEENPVRVRKLATNYGDMFEILELRKDVLIKITTRLLEQ